jgi:hypothetical protein
MKFLSHVLAPVVDRLSRWILAARVRWRGTDGRDGPKGLRRVGAVQVGMEAGEPSVLSSSPSRHAACGSRSIGRSIVTEWIATDLRERVIRVSRWNLRPPHHERGD